MPDASDTASPTGCPPEMLDSLIEMLDAVFRPGMEEAFPHVIAPENLENCRVTIADGKVVSHIGYTLNDAVILGARIKVACLGAVGTLEEYRGRGCASAEMIDCLERMHSQGVHLLMVSGSRNMYRRNHCVQVGRDFTWSATADDVAGPASDGVELVPVTPENLDEMIAAQELDPVRFDRTRALWLMALEWNSLSWRAAQVLGIREGGSEGISAYVIITPPNDRGWCRVHEWGGSRRAFLGAMRAVFERLGGSSADIHVAGWDEQMLSLLGDAGIGTEESPASGTQRIIRFVELMEGLRPVFAERIGAKEAAALKFSEADEAFAIGLGDSQLVIPDRDSLTKVVFGTHEGAERKLLAGSAAADAMRECLSVPALNYGISYV